MTSFAEGNEETVTPSETTVEESQTVKSVPKTIDTIKRDWGDIKDQFVGMYFSVRLKDKELVIFHTKKVCEMLIELKNSHMMIEKKENSTINESIKLYTTLSKELETQYDTISYGKKIGYVLKMKTEINKIGGQIKKLKPTK